jgi:hypothetical protein
VRLSTDYFPWGGAIIQMIIYGFFYVCYFLVLFLFAFWQWVFVPTLCVASVASNLIHKFIYTRCDALVFFDSTQDTKCVIVSEVDEGLLIGIHLHNWHHITEANIVVLFIHFFWTIDTVIATGNTCMWVSVKWKTKNWNWWIYTHGSHKLGFVGNWNT